MIHLGVARGIWPVLVELGADPQRMIAEAGIDPRLFDDAGNVISFADLGRLVSDCTRRLDCPHFALLVGARARIASLGLVGQLMRHSGTIGAALQAVEAHLCIQNRGAVPVLEVFDDLAVFSYSPYDPGSVGAALNSEAAIAATVGVLRQLAGADWSPLEIMLPRSAPPMLEPYRRVFRAPVRFDQEIAAIVFPAAFLDERIAGADPALYREAEAQVLCIESLQERSLTDRLRRMLRIDLMRIHCTAGSVADRLAVNRRTLNRRLKAEGTSFRAISNEIRYEIARQLIADTRLDLSDVAAMLDFSEPPAFTRAFRRWAGCTPSAWRQQCSAPGNGAPVEDRCGGLVSRPIP